MTAADTSGNFRGEGATATRTPPSSLIMSPRNSRAAVLLAARYTSMPAAWVFSANTSKSPSVFDPNPSRSPQEPTLITPDGVKAGLG
jgi:hypothetical protein